MSGGSAGSKTITADDVASAFRDWYHVLVLAILIGFMFGSRIQRLDRFMGADTLELQGVDSYYHWRTTEWTVANVPFTMPFEVWTGFPSGQYVGQFGTLFDQLIAMFAFVIGLGSPTPDDILLAALLGVPIMGALVALPVYKMGERLAGRLAGLTGVAILALSPGVFFQRSTAGFFDHHVAEVLFMAVAVFALMVALRYGERDHPVYEHLLDRDWEALRRPTTYAALAGLAFALYVLVWPPAILLVGIVGIYLVIAIAVDHVRGESTEPIAYVAGVTFGVATILILPFVELFAISGSPTSFSLLQPLLTVGVAIAAVFLAAVSRVWDLQGMTKRSYPVGVGVTIVLGFAVLWLVFPDVYGTIISNLTGRLLPLDPSAGSLTIQEARPPDQPAQFMYSQFGFAFYSMFLGLGILAIGPFAGREYRREHLLIIVWSLFLVSMALTQIRFSYYLVLAVAVGNAVVVGAILRWTDLTRLEALRNLKTFQVLTVILVVVLLFAPLVPPVASATVLDVGQTVGPSGSAVVWSDANEYLQDNSPVPGAWGPHDNTDELEYFGTYPNPGSGGHDYPAGGYGVMSWWDYGHLITTQANRIPHANPFQQNARSAATYLLAEDEERAELVLDAIAHRGDGVRNVPNEELEAIIAGGGDPEGEEIRYVMIDDEMAGPKFAAKTEWTGQGMGPFVTQDRFRLNEGNETLPTANDRYHDTMLARLYRGDARGLEHYRLVHEIDQFSIVGGFIEGDRVAPLGSFRISGSWEELADIDRQLRANARDDLVTPIQPGLSTYDSGIYSSVKTFERVEGATLTGTAANASHGILVEVELRTNTDRTFTYTQLAETDDEGRFEVTVPYATTNDLGPEDGCTDTAVVATGNYTVYASQAPHLVGLLPPAEVAEVAVPERAVYDGDKIPVELAEPAVFQLSDFEAPERVVANETFEVTVDVTNDGGATDTQAVTFLVDGDEVDAATVTLAGGETRTVRFTTSIAEEGVHDLRIESGQTFAQRGIAVDPAE